MINNTLPNIITRSRYRQINKYIYISDNPFIFTKNIYDNNKSQKINFMTDYFNNKWKGMYSFTKFITIYESMRNYKGEIYFKQYMKDKHKKFGIKFFVKASDDSGYIYQCLPYFGKAFSYDKNVGIGTTIKKNVKRT